MKNLFLNFHCASILTGQKFHAPPNTDRHDAVMRDVIKIHKVEALAENEDECLEEVGELAEIIPPTASRDLQNLPE